MKKLYRLTEEGLKELKAELESLISRRPEVAETIKIARDLGDLGENAEYQSARNDQERDENRISEIESIIQNVEIIHRPKSDNKVRLGSIVKLKGPKGNKEFQIVGTVEADPLSGKVSDESPIGSELLGKKVGDNLTIRTSLEEIVYKIVSIE